MSARHAMVPLYLACCLMLGGASAAGFLANMLLQLAAIPIIAAALLTQPRAGTSLPARRLLALAALLVCLFAVQLVPLPPEIWTALPGRAPVAQGFEMLGQPLPWLPLSLTPAKTISSLLWLLPAFAVLLGIVRLGSFRPSWLAWTIIALMVLSVSVGALQVAGGTQSHWYFYQITNFGFAVGFFANNNHMATLLLVSIPFLAAFIAGAIGRRRRRVRDSSGLLVLTGTILLVVVVGLAINTSLAGLGLAVPTAGASVLLARSRHKAMPRWAVALIGLFALAAVAGVLTAPFGNNLTTQEARGSAESRYTSFNRTLGAALDYLPVGSGIGSFQQVYRANEDPAGVTATYMNHAHSDLLEILLETGLPGLLLLAAFLLWWAQRTRAIWRSEEPDLFARAATIASAAIVAHSLVDYPLRTAAISAVFAAMLALMAEPRPNVRRTPSEEEPQARHLSAD